MFEVFGISMVFMAADFVVELGSAKSEEHKVKIVRRMN